ncbi:hypothetical protein RIF29_27498 [Crotalaria pallida]|uniref:Serpin domain-containing protein n=1 Tax=Crotalaria pallida TaxID=3830 RepID=A0AAN9EQ37_CROPI
MDLRESINYQTNVALNFTKYLFSKEGHDKNLVFSPLSLHVVLSIIAAGSEGPTLDQFRSKSTVQLNSFASQLVSVVLSFELPSYERRIYSVCTKTDIFRFDEDKFFPFI